MIEIHVTCKDGKEAEKISGALLDKKLAVCANHFGVKSIYRWKGKIEKANETMLILKASKKNSTKIVKTIKSLHSYETPAIVIYDAKSDKDTGKWIEEESP